MIQNDLRIWTIIFDIHLGTAEIPMLRGAIISAVRKHSIDEQLNETAPLFHNHLGDSFRNAYPLIQYKILGGRAAIVCVGEGVAAIGTFLSSSDLKMEIGHRSVHMGIFNSAPLRFQFRIDETKHQYHLRRWAPLNSDNLLRYNELVSLKDRIELLEGILTGNILSMLKGLGVFVETRIQCSILSLSEPYFEGYKGTGVMSFDVCFSSNIVLPENIGLGKHASVGFGVLENYHQQT